MGWLRVTVVFWGILSTQLVGCGGSGYRSHPSPPSPALQRENARLEREHEEKMARRKANPDGYADSVQDASPKDQFSSCFQELSDDPDLKPIKGKLALIPKEGHAFNILTNNSKPTKAEKVAIRAYSEKAMACMSILDAPFNAAPSAARDAFNNSKNGMQSLLASLYVGEITYGGYARSLTDLMSREKRAIDEAVSDERRQLAERENLQIQQNIERDKAYSASQQARATEDLVSAQRSANWIRMMQGFQQSLYQQQSINCTSRQSFGTVNTTCY